ncbi:hypothetical protein D6D01_08602 [Aureobasidium pullulans]|uniref:F-box domain-containing protein n=1 Tax=Aureobasidium pullulans TaxID=5580 RepID=A0A4S9KAF4_AURPU|nr:hypothetical protein D6D01_08602 [Aureobasidium pullulans]
MVRTSIRHGRFSLTGNVQVAVQDANPLLLGMPNEVLSMIVDHAGPQAFPALRLTNKHLRAIANKPFAILHFSERKHVQSLHSMEALVEITAHAFFGIFVKKVIVSAFRPESERTREYPVTCGSCRRPMYDRYCIDHAPRHIVMTPEQFRGKLDDVFSNIARISHSVSIGICGDPLGCYGSKTYATCVNIVQKSQQRKYCGLRFLSYCLGKTFGQIQEATQNSGCEIQGVKIELLGRGPSDLRYRYLKNNIDALMKRLVVSLSKPLSLDLSLESRKHVEQLRYDRKTGAMDLSGLEFGSRFLNYTGHLGDVLSCLSAFRVTVINIQDCRFDRSEYLKILFSSTLERLTLQTVFLETGHFERNLWSSLLSKLSGLKGLKCLDIRHAIYHLEREEDDGHWLQLPIGRYKFKKNGPCWHGGFHLALSTDQDGGIILADEGGLSAQLKALGETVAQMEVDKIAEIRRDGFIRTDIVGIPKDVKSDEDEEEAEDGDENEVAGPIEEESEGDDNDDEYEDED